MEIENETQLRELAAKHRIWSYFPKTRPVEFDLSISNAMALLDYAQNSEEFCLIAQIQDNAAQLDLHPRQG